MPKKCLLLQLPNQNQSDFREVLTEEKNEQSLTEFIKTFGIKTYLVEADEPQLLTTDEIVSYFCDQYKEPIKCKYQITKNEITRDKMLKNVYDIRSFIEEELKYGNTVRIKELHQKFSPHNIAVSTIYRHLSFVKNKLKTEGKTIDKIMVGCYKLV